MSSLAARFAGAKAVLWDVDGTLADSTSLGFTSTNAVLVEAGLPPIDLAQYKRGTRYPTPERMAWHAAGDPSDPVGKRLGARFDEHYVRLVDTDTAGFYAGVREVVEALHERKNGAQAVLSNACGAYARRVVAANDAEKYFKTVRGADDVSEPKTQPFGFDRHRARKRLGHENVRVRGRLAQRRRRRESRRHDGARLRVGRARSRRLGRQSRSRRPHGIGAEPNAAVMPCIIQSVSCETRDI
jgi:phosphoglycolate phosphatase-like HAD superfamily hydrolase